MKRLVSVLLVAIMLLSMFTFTSCQTNQIPTEDFVLNGETLDPNKEIEITFYHTMGANLRNVLDIYIKEFKELYPNITVVATQEGGYDDVRDKISKQLTTGAQPNIAYCYPDHVALYELTGFSVVTLDQFIEDPTLGLTQAQIDDFIDAYYEEGRQFGDGMMYTLPMVKSTEVLYYNVDFFEEHNLKVPETWDELEEVCQKILEIDPDCVPLGYDSEANWFITMCEQLKSGYTSNEDPANRFLFDNDENKAFVKRFAEWYEKGYITTQEIYGAYTSNLFKETNPSKQRAYMCIGSSAGASNQCPAKNEDGTYPFEVGITSIPQADASNKKVISQGPSLCVLNNVDRQEVIASWLFVKFLTTNVNFQAEFSQASGYVPVLESVFETDYYKEEVLGTADGNAGITGLSAKVCMEQREYYYVSPAFNGSSAARDQVGSLMQSVFTKYAELVDAGASEDEITAMIDKEFADAVKTCKRVTGKK